MDLTHPAYDVLGKNRARVLLRLSLLADGASGRSIHALAGVKALRTTQQILDDLTSIGLVDVRRIGSGNVYTLNREHVLWAPIETILAAPARTEQEITEIVASTLGEHTVVTLLYGSFARRDAGPDSDIDLFVVWKDDVDENLATELIDESTRRIRRLTGNDAQLLAVKTAELEGLIARSDPIIDSLQADARPLGTSTNVSVNQLLSGPR